MDGTRGALGMSRLFLRCICAALPLLLLLTAACGARAPSDAAVPAAEPGAQPTAEATPAFADFTATDLDGNEVTEDIFADHSLTMVNVWGTYCSPCIREMPDLGALSEEYADKGVQFIGIVIDVPRIDHPLLDTAKQIVADTGADYLHLLPSDDLAEIKLNTVTAIPTTFFVDAAGNIVSRDFVGSNSADGWRRVIDDILALML